MTYDQLYSEIQKKGSFLCVGLDTDIEKIPSCIKEEVKKQGLSESAALFLFNKRIIDATAPYAVAFKLNTAFYEALGAEGFSQMEESVKYIRANYPNIFIIVDAKRGDIGNTARQYAKAFFKRMDCDAVTVSPYMGGDAVLPFLEYE
ncbi:MAG: orotidine-5'-phosphate decarboxylase, partial [Bacteroidales bacterium]|nr:orotidine-5'-phosphate decarboxylase [Bacteroidales bacterium]